MKLSELAASSHKILFVGFAVFVLKEISAEPKVPEIKPSKLSEPL